MDTEYIVFVDEHGRPTGRTGPKLASHHRHTRLHLAFSCYLFDDAGRLLITQRALTKKVWPGVWTNSFCGHPAPGEALEAAVQRRAGFELGAQVTDVTGVVPDYRYTTPPFRGIIENEYCPIFTARIAGGLKPNPDEVEAYEWVGKDDYVARLMDHPDRFSYWAKDQLAHLQRVGLMSS